MHEQGGIIFGDLLIRPLGCRNRLHAQGLLPFVDKFESSTYQPVELPQSRDPPEQAQLDLIDAASNLSHTRSSPQMHVALSHEGTKTQQVPKKQLPPDDSRGWGWGQTPVQQFQVQLDATKARDWGWDKCRGALTWEVAMADAPVVTPPAGDPLIQHHSATSHQPLQLPGLGGTQSRGSMCAHVHMTQEHVHVPAAGSALEPGWDSRTKSETYFPEEVWDKAHKPPYVHVVNTAVGAQRAMKLLRGLVDKDKAAAQAHAPVNDYGRQYWSRRIFACDTEV